MAQGCGAQRCRACRARTLFGAELRECAGLGARRGVELPRVADRVVAKPKIISGAHLPLMCEWEDVRMKLLLLSIAGVLAADAFAQETATPTRRSPEQIFSFLDKDKNGALS